MPIDAQVEEGAFVRGAEDHGSGDLLLEQFQPAGGADTPAIPGLQARKVVLGPRRREIVSDPEARREEDVGDFHADGVAADIFLAGVAVAVAKETRPRRVRARF